MQTAPTARDTLMSTHMCLPPPQRHTTLCSTTTLTHFTHAQKHALRAAHTQHTLLMYLRTSCAPLPDVPPMQGFLAAEKDGWRLLSHAFVHSSIVY